MLRALAIATICLSVLGCAPSRTLAELEPDLMPLRQEYEDCVAKVAQHYAKQDVTLRQVILAGDTLCGEKRQAIRDLLFENVIDTRLSSAYLDKLDDDIAFTAALAMRQAREAAGGPVAR